MTSGKNKQKKLDLYGLSDLDKKVLKLLDEGHYTTNISQILDYSVSYIHKRIQALRSRDLVVKQNSTKPVEYKVKADISGLKLNNESNNWGEVGAPQKALIRIHGSRICFSNLSDVFEKFDKNRDKLSKLGAFEKIKSYGKGKRSYDSFLFSFSGWEFEFKRNLVLCYPLKRDQVFNKRGFFVGSEDIEESGSWGFEKVINRALDRAEEKMRGLLGYLRSKSNYFFNFSYGRDIGLREDPFIQDLHFSYLPDPEERSELGDVEIDLVRDGNKIKFPEGVYFDRSISQGEVEAEGKKGLDFARSIESSFLEDSEASRSEVLSRALNRYNDGGPVTRSEIRDLRKELRSLKEDLENDLPKKIFEILKNEALDEARDPDELQGSNPGQVNEDPDEPEEEKFNNMYV